MAKNLDISKWNWRAHAYEPYQPNEDWNVVLYSDNMDLAINCTACGKNMTYGQGFTSRELHNSLGLGYPVCETDYEEERAREQAEGRP